MQVESRSSEKSDSNHSVESTESQKRYVFHKEILWEVYHIGDSFLFLPQPFSINGTDLYTLYIYINYICER